MVLFRQNVLITNIYSHDGYIRVEITVRVYWLLTFFEKVTVFCDDKTLYDPAHDI